MAKIHLVIAVEPIESGTTVVSLCGEKVPQAEAVPLTEVEVVPRGHSELRATFGFCKECFGKQYFYAVTSGQDSEDMKS